MFFRQLGVIIKKDLLVIGLRSFPSTFIRALVWPVILAIVFVNIKTWTADHGLHGVGQITPILPFSDALSQSGNSRPRIVIVNNGITDGDIGEVIQDLSTTIRNSNKELHIVSTYSDLVKLCPESNTGVSPCHGAVQFYSSPGHGNTNWNYTYYEDASLGSAPDVSSTNNDRQIYTYPFMHAISDSISRVQNGSSLPQIQQFPFTYFTQAQVDKQQAQNWQNLVVTFMGFAFFIAFSGICYHLPGYVTYEREQGLLGLMDAMMQHRNRWHPFVVRTLATHVSFDIIYLPSWIIIGGIMKLSFPMTNIGWLILTGVLFGLALTSYSILVSSLFKRSQLAAICGIVAAISLNLVAEFAESPFLGGNLAGAIATGLLFPPSTFIYIINNFAFFEALSYPFDANMNPPFDSENLQPDWVLPSAPFFAFFLFQFLLYPILAIVIEKSLWSTASARRKLRSSEEMGLVAVRLDGFSRYFKNRVNKKQTVKAVDNLSLDVHKGSITMLLGHNGSGKSTTLNAIAGLETITSGSIELDGTGGIGICPQKNIMWDSLTVEENISIFECLKFSGRQTRSQHREEVTRLIEGCDLEMKTKAKAKTLSGGQKRKLQLAMMFAGGSKVCCIDEASSGIDPLARRKIWDILLAERGHRSMLLTTHFLDEADVLSDHVIIMSKGEKRAEGPVAALKRQLGGGYRVMVLGNVPLPQIPGVKRSSDYTYTVFETDDKATLTRIVIALEQKNVFDYRIQGPTIENVFLKLIDEVKESKVAAEFVLSEDADKRLLELYTGKGCGFWQQTWALYKKRLMILRHNYMPYVCALFASLVVAGLVTRFLLGDKWASKNPNGLLCVDPSLDISIPYVQTLYPNEVAYGLTFGPPSLNSTIQRLVPGCSPDQYCDDTSVDWSQMVALNSSAELYSDFKNNGTNQFLGGFYVGTGSPLFAWQAESWGSPLPITLLDSILLDQTLDVGYQPFAKSYIPGDMVVSLLVVFTTLGFAIYPCLFALYPTAERLRRVRAMQYSNGIRASSLWTAHALFDLVFVLVISIVTVGIWMSQWSGWYGIGYMFVVFFLYGLASTAFSYVVSKMVKSQVAALAVTLIVQVIIGMLFFLACLLIVDQAPSALVYTWMNYVYFTIGIISPAVHLARGLSMAVNNWSLVCRGTAKASYPGEITIYGGPILYLTLQFVLLLLLLIYWESGWSLEVLGIRRKAKAVDGSVPKDTMESHERLSSQNTGLRVINVSKHFGKNRAVDNVSFGILPSEKFALTGINGAGKTTLISLIRDDLQGSGSIFVGGDSMQNSPMAAKSHMGVCPQFDAQDLMTVKEHLRFYASVRGVPHKEHNMNLLIEQLGLTPHANKLAKKLSGGNQRKLSLAIALIGNPSVLLLDEPSSGMDPAAKRALWRTLSAISAGRSLLITTHSMEEADALCDRAGIMAGKLLALGDMTELRQQHGDAAFVHMVHKDAPHSHQLDVERMRTFVLSKFPDAQLEMKSFGGQLRFSIPRTGMSLGQLYKLFEEQKDQLGIAEYSVGPATLNEVFLNVMREHDVQEENSEEKGQKWYSV